MSSSVFDSLGSVPRLTLDMRTLFSNITEPNCHPAEGLLNIYIEKFSPIPSCDTNLYLWKNVALVVKAFVGGPVSETALAKRVGHTSGGRSCDGIFDQRVEEH